MSLKNVIELIEDKKARKTKRTGVHYHTIIEDTDELDPGSFSLKRGKRYVYCVHTEDAGSSDAEGKSSTLRIKEPDTSDYINLNISYVARCPKESQLDLIKKLGRYGDPDDLLNSIIKSAVDEYTWDRSKEFFSNLEDARIALSKHVEKVVTDKTGLRFRAKVVLEDEDKLSSIPVNETIEVRFVDSHENMKLSVQADFDVDVEGAARALIALVKSSKIPYRVAEHVKDFFRHNVSAQSYMDNFVNTTVKADLAKSLQAAFAPEGRKVSNLALKTSRSASVFEREVKITLNEFAKTLERESPIELQSEVLLSLDNVATFHASQVSDIHKWIKNAFKEIVDNVCFEKKYVDYLKEDTWTKIKDDIEDGMRSKAAHIGYSIKQIFSHPKLEENKYKKPHSHEFKINQLPLHTSAHTRVDLVVYATFSFNKWAEDPLESKINNGIDLEQDIHRVLTDALTQVLVEVSPNDFYQKFKSVEDSHESTEQKMIEAVQTRLKKEYAADVYNITILPTDTLEVKKVKELLDKPHTSSFTIQPTVAMQNAVREEVQFHITWRVVDIDSNSWHKVIRDFCDEQKISAAITEALVGTFKTIPAEILNVRKPGESKALQELALDRAQDYVRENYGVIVELTNLHRDLTDIDRKYIEKDIAVETKRIEHQQEEQIKEIEHNSSLREKLREKEVNLIENQNSVQETEWQELQDLSGRDERDKSAKVRDRIKYLEDKLQTETPDTGRQAYTGENNDNRSSKHETDAVSYLQKLKAEYTSSAIEHKETTEEDKTEVIEGEILATDESKGS